MTTYEIRENRDYNSREVYFDGKPSEATRTALKGLKMRWHSLKKCWYGYASESELINAIQSAEQQDGGEGATVYTDGYMGGGACYGHKSNQGLYGAELAAAIRADIKAAGIKGVTISKGKSTYTDTITATVTIEQSDIITNFELDDIDILNDLNRYGVYDGERWYHWGNLDKNGSGIDTSSEEFQSLRKAASAYQIQQYSGAQSINQYYLDEKHYPEFTAVFLAKLQKIRDIISAYRYNESNSMVDYFNTNFYYDIRTKPGKSWTAQTTAA